MFRRGPRRMARSSFGSLPGASTRLASTPSEVTTASLRSPARIIRACRNQRAQQEASYPSVTVCVFEFRDARQHPACHHSLLRAHAHPAIADTWTAAVNLVVVKSDGSRPDRPDYLGGGGQARRHRAACNRGHGLLRGCVEFTCAGRQKGNQRKALSPEIEVRANGADRE